MQDRELKLTKALSVTQTVWLTLNQTYSDLKATNLSFRPFFIYSFRFGAPELFFSKKGLYSGVKQPCFISDSIGSELIVPYDQNKGLIFSVFAKEASGLTKIYTFYVAE